MSDNSLLRKVKVNHVDPELCIPDVRYLASVANPEDERVCPAQFRSVIQTLIFLDQILSDRVTKRIV